MFRNGIFCRLAGLWRDLLPGPRLRRPSKRMAVRLNAFFTGMAKQVLDSQTQQFRMLDCKFSPFPAGNGIHGDLEDVCKLGLRETQLFALCFKFSWLHDFSHRRNIRNCGLLHSSNARRIYGCERWKAAKSLFLRNGECGNSGKHQSRIDLHFLLSLRRFVNQFRPVSELRASLFQRLRIGPGTIQVLLIQLFRCCKLQNALSYSS